MPPPAWPNEETGSACPNLRRKDSLPLGLENFRDSCLAPPRDTTIQNEGATNIPALPTSMIAEKYATEKQSEEERGVGLGGLPSFFEKNKLFDAQNKLQNDCISSLSGPDSPDTQDRLASLANGQSSGTLPEESEVPRILDRTASHIFWQPAESPVVKCPQPDLLLPVQQPLPLQSLAGSRFQNLPLPPPPPPLPPLSSLSILPPPPPPPPLPPPKFPLPPLVQSPLSTQRLSLPPVQTETRLLKLMERLRETQAQQDEHRELREMALTERHALQQTRKSLCDHRQRTRDTEVKLITELRQVCLNTKQLDYEVLFGLYQEINDAQDSLGSLEEDYDAQQRSYDILEWQLSKYECDLVGDLIEDMEDLGLVPPESTCSLSVSDKKSAAPVGFPLEPLTPNPTSSLALKVPGASELISDARLAQNWSGSTTECSDLDLDHDLAEEEAFNNAVDEPETQFTDRVDHLIEQASKTLEEHQTRPASMPIKSISSFYLTPNSTRRAQSEGGLAHIGPRWPSIRDHVNQWLWESLAESHMEKVIAKAHSEGEIAGAQSSEILIDRRTWWNLCKEFWAASSTSEQPNS